MHIRGLRWVQALALLGSLAVGAPRAVSLMQAGQSPSSAQPGTLAAGGVLTGDALQNLLPATVYFQGKTAPLQLRNAAAFRLAEGDLAWVALVDSSGYASDVQEKYQFYLVTEDPLRFGTATLPAGAYGGGFVGQNFLLMDLGGHTLAQGPVAVDPALHRPRPLQVVSAPGQPGLRLYLGRRWVLLQSGASGASR